MKKYKPHDEHFSITEKEKGELKAKIFTSINSIKRRKRRWIYGSSVAASMLILLSLGIYSIRNTEQSITDFVNASSEVEIKGSDKVTVILNEGKGVMVEGETASISYSKTGEQIDVGAQNTLSQKTTEGKKVTYNTILVPYGKRSKLQLSDGSIVWLNSGSRLVYPARFTADKREVYLDGEAIFEVAHKKEHPFTVVSKNQEVSVLGTVFNVSSYADDDNNFVVLKSGSVQISYGNDFPKTKGQKMIISPGTMANLNLDNKKISSKKVDVNQYFAWREGVLILRNHDLEYIMRRLSRYYNVSISILDEDLGKETFSGYLDLKEDVEKVIKIIEKTTNLKYEKAEENLIKITYQN